MFTEPHWLLLLLPALWLLFQLGMPNKKILILRILIVVCVIAALAGASMRLPDRDGMIIVVADRSLSMPADSEARIKETVNILKQAIPANGKLGMVSFARHAKVEMSPADSVFSGFSHEYEPGASNLAQAIEKSLSLIPPDSSGRILLLSDGQWTGQDPRQVAFKAARRGISLDFRFLGRNAINNLHIEDFQVPGLLNPGEAFVISARVFVPVEQSAQIILKAGDKLISSFNKKLGAGSNSVVFRHVAPESSVIKYRLEITGNEIDPMPENNVAEALTEVRGKKPVLLVTEQTAPTLAKLLEASKIAYEIKKTFQISWNIENLAGYSAVILDNVSANSVSVHGMSVLNAWIKHLGGGLLLTGGKNSYGSGGYYQSPLEEALPVSLELRSQHRKLKLALVIVLDRSGSMTAPTRGGRTKMDLANMASAGCVDLLSPMDEIGVLAVDTEPHVVVDLQKIEQKEALRNKILRIESSGGGIYVEKGLTKAIEMLMSAEAMTRHIILFADASDSEQPGRYWELLGNAAKAGITVSVIGLGTDSDPDANLLQKIADAGQGRIFFTREPEELPRLFSQDTFVAAKSTFVDEPTAFKSTNALKRFFANDYTVESEVGGYNVCYLRPGAELMLYTTDENKSPILAGWNYGLGRVACYSGATSDKFIGKFGREKQIAEVFGAVFKWLMPDDRQAIENMPVTQQIVRGEWQSTLHLDPEREREFFTENPVVTVMRSRAGVEPEQIVKQMNWQTADSLQVSLPLAADETIVAMVDAGNNRRLQLYPICQMYSQEYRAVRLNEGLDKLRELAEITGGEESINLSTMWSNMPHKMQLRSLSEFLMYLALFFFILEVAERRTSVLTLIGQRLGNLKKPVKKVVRPVEDRFDKSVPEKVSRLDEPAFIHENETEKKKPENREKSDGFLSALQSAKKRAGKRTGK